MNGMLGRVAIVAGCSMLAALFAWLNAGERVTLRFGLFTLRSIPVSAVVFAAIFVGMAMLFLAGLRADLRTRRMIQRYREALGQETPAGRAESPVEDV